MERSRYVVERLSPDVDPDVDPDFDLVRFDCGEPAYNEWLVRRALTSVRAGVCAVYLLLEPAERTVVGYYAVSPTLVVRAEVPPTLSRGWPQQVPGWKLGKLAVDQRLRGDPAVRWGRLLLRHALRTIVDLAEAGGGKVIVVDADNQGLVGFYRRNGFRALAAESLTLYLKVSTARQALL